VTASNGEAEQARSFHSRAPEQTRRAAAALARAWRETAEGAGLVISLRGDLGAGKTVFVKGLAEGLGLDATQVSSPTFVLANSYPAPDGAALHHVDFYRIEEAAELEDMGFFDLMAPGALLAVEWGEQFDHALPRERLEIAIERAGETDRRIEATGHGALACAVVRAWRLVVESGGVA
jgi:tRNA threonylcarbamoyladenosine biosynthesis protein TsaE